MTRVAFIGAGSVVFTKNLLTDLLSFPALRDIEVALHDSDRERLETAGLMARWTAAQLGAAPRVSEHAERRAALAGADVVINMVQIGMHAATRLDFEIPRRYGLKQTIADTLGIGGIFRGLRTIPFMLDLAADMTELCPDALLLNYTNPMSMLVWAVYRRYPRLRVIGLCHSVQYTAQQLAEYIGVDPGRLVYDCAGINHIAWMTRLEVDGNDVYPRLRAALDDPAIYARDKVRFELLRNLGYFVTESSEHNAEYTPYFLRDDALIERFDIPVDEYIRRSERNLEVYAATRRALLDGASFELRPSPEYGAPIVNALVTGETRLVYGNVENAGLIDNLPVGCCVEVPVVVDRAGLRPCHVGALPPQCAGMCVQHVAVQELVVRAALEGNREHVYHAAMLDRHATSVLNLDQLRALVGELLDAHGAAMPEGVRTR